MLRRCPDRDLQPADRPREHRWGTATVEEFEALAAEVSGVDLTGFFQAWLVDRRRPDASAENGF